MAKIIFRFVDGTSSENNIPEGFAVKYAEIEKQERLINRKDLRLKKTVF